MEYKICAFCEMPFLQDGHFRICCSTECRLNKRRRDRGYARHRAAEAAGSPMAFWLYEDGIIDEQAIDMVVIDGTRHRLTRTEAYEATRRLIRRGFSARNIARALGYPPSGAVTDLYQRARRQLESEGFQWMQTSKYTNVQH